MKTENKTIEIEIPTEKQTKFITRMLVKFITRMLVGFTLWLINRKARKDLKVIQNDPAKLKEIRETYSKAKSEMERIVKLHGLGECEEVDRLSKVIENHLQNLK